MTAEMLTLSDHPRECEYLLVATRPGHTLTGCETGLETALAVARGLAIGGWRVTVRSADPYFEDPLITEVWAENAA